MSNLNAGWLRGWAYKAESGRRDLRLDLLRGYAVLAMIVDHFGGRSLITPLTGYNQFLVSAAEAFVFLSGFVMGLVYGRRIERVGWLATTEAILRRAAVLYFVTVGLTLLFVGLFLFTDLRLWLDRTYGLGLTDPAEVIVGTLTLHYTYHGTDILWMYTVMIAAAPILFHLLATGRTSLLLGGSALLWLAYQNFPARAAIPWVVDNAVYFPVAAWQLYFVAGLTLGYHRDALSRRLAGVPRWPALAVVGLLFLGLIALHWGHESGRLATWPLLKGLAGETYAEIFDKPRVSWGRVVAFAIAAGFFYLLVSLLWRPIHQLTGRLLIPLGQAALLAYGLHLIVIVVVYNLAAWEFDEQALLTNTALQLVTVAIVWLLVEWWDRLEALPRRVVGLLEGSATGIERRRPVLVAVTALLLLVSGLTAVLVGPVRAARTAAQAELAEAGTLLAVPEVVEAARPAPILLVLHDTGSTGPAAAAPRAERAQQSGWIVVAPSLEYGAWASADDVRAAVGELLPELRELVGGMDEHVDRQTRPEVYLYGVGRGGQLAELFALFYPDLVRAVAIVDAIPCTVPRSSLDFPEGIADLGVYRDDPVDPSEIGAVAFFIQPAAPGGAEAGQSCAWLGREVDARQQLEQVVAALAGLGAELQIVRAEQPEPARRALQFFADLPPPPAAGLD